MQGAVPVRDDDTPETLAARVIQIEHRIYPEALRLLASVQDPPGRRSLQDVRNPAVFGRQPDLTPRARVRRVVSEILGVMPVSNHDRADLKFRRPLRFSRGCFSARSRTRSVSNRLVFVERAESARADRRDVDESRPCPRRPA